MKAKTVFIGFLLLVLPFLLSACAAEKQYRTKYSVVFWCEGQIVSRCYVYEGEAINESDIPPLPEKIPGYFWEMESLPEKITKDTTIRINKRAETYTVTFDTGEVIDFVYDLAMTKMPTPKKDGYEFLGYVYNDKLYTPESFFDLTESVTMNASWKLLFEYEEKESGIKLTKYSGDSEEVTVPVQIDGKIVVEIEKGLLGGVKMRKLTLPFLGATETVDRTSYIGYIFGSEENDIPENLREVDIVKADKIAEKAFYGCKKLTQINLPDGVEEIGDYAFYDCNRLTKINLKRVKVIGGHSFENCNGVEFRTLEMPLIVSIGEYAFAGCGSIVKISMNKVETIGGYAFYNCSALRNVNISAGNPPVIEEKVFYMDSDDGEPVIILDLKIRVPKPTSYRAAEGWSEYSENLTMMSSSDSVVDGDTK